MGDKQTVTEREGRHAEQDTQMSTDHRIRKHRKFTSGTIHPVSVTLLMLRSNTPVTQLNTVYLVAQCGSQEFIYIFNSPFDS